ncbi:MAG: hypothetical protein AAF517_20815, partial [Planctomycetota bacterium]
LKDAKASWEDRYRVFHKGRWGKGQAAKARDNGFAVRNQRFRLVGRKTLYDMEKDPSQKKNVIADHPDAAKQMNAYYDKWFDGALPNMVNEDAELTGHNTFHLMFWKQYGIEIPPVKKRKPRAKKRNRQNRQRKKQAKSSGAVSSS